MKAVGLFKYLPSSHPESLIDLELPTPCPQEHDLLVRVEAVSVNPVDTKVRSPKPQVEAEPRILGWDAVGVVERIGAKVGLFKPGDSVYYAGDITRPGCNSRYHVVDERLAALQPRTLDFAQAAALPLVSITAYEALYERLGVDPEGRSTGRTLLIIGGAGGVGSMAIQLARRAGLTVVATASRPESTEWVRRLGAHHVVDHRRALRPQLEAIGMQSVDLIANFADTDAYWEAMADLVAPQGKICTIVDHSGHLDHGLLKMKSITHAWEFMFTRAKYRTPDMIEQHHILRRIAAWVDDGSVAGILHDRLAPICAVTLRAAHAKLESGTMIGKLVVEGW